MKKDSLDQLLAGGFLSGAQYDEIEQRVLARVAPRTLRFAWSVPAALVPIFSAAAIAFVVLSFRAPAAKFSSKGGSLSHAAAVDIACGPSGGRVCSPGSTLFFIANAALTSGYVGAYAVRIDVKGAPRIWYFPDGKGNAPRIERGTGTVVLPQGVFIGPEHTSGRYRIVVWVSASPTTRAEGSALSSSSGASFEVDVI